MIGIWDSDDRNDNINVIVVISYNVYISKINNTDTLSLTFKLLGNI